VGYQRVFTMDADFSHDPNSLPILRTALDDADVALGSRYVPGGVRYAGLCGGACFSKGGSAYAAVDAWTIYPRSDGGFKGFRRQVLEILLPEMDTMRSNGYAFQIETTYSLLRHAFVLLRFLYFSRIARWVSLR